MLDLIFIHGFLSSSKSSKITHFKQVFPSSQIGSLIENYHAIELYPTLQEFEQMTISGLANKLRNYIKNLSNDVILVGSSHGALLTLATQQLIPDNIAGFVLLAPSFNSYESFQNSFDYQKWKEDGVVEFYHPRLERYVTLGYQYLEDSIKYQTWERVDVPILLIHGKDDQVTPLAKSREYAAKQPDCTEMYPAQGLHNLSNVLHLVSDTIVSWIFSKFGSSDGVGH